ncbi:B12-binding domain-containing radical SAM protein (plasmid) [Ensifer sp. D2-11]
MEQRDPAFTFIFPSVLNGRLFDGFDFHLGAGYIRAYLALYNIPTIQFLSDGSHSVAEVAKAVLLTQPLMVGFSCYDVNYHLVRILAREIKRQGPEVPIVVGGPSATFSDQLIMQDCDVIDVCARSYAEESCLDLVRWRQGEIDLQSIQGISYRAGGQVIRNRDRPMPVRPVSAASTLVDAPSDESAFKETGGALDAYPDPYVGGFIPPKRVSDVGLITSRGCTFACTFCNFSAMSGRSFATHSLEYQLRVFDFLNSELTGPGRTLVTINDDNFSLQGKRFHELLRRMKDRRYGNLSFWAEMRTEPMNDESFRLLRAAGFVEINFGLESGSPKVLAAMKKVRSSGWQRDSYAKESAFLERIAWAVRQSRESGIRTTVSVILGAPDESEAEGLATLQFVEELQVDTYAHNFLGVGDGTELAATYADWGISVEYPIDRVLPAVTTLPYDVHQLRILKNDRAWLAMTGFELRQATLLLTGVGHLPISAPRPRSFGRGGSGRLPDDDVAAPLEESGPVLGIAEIAADEETAEWLADTMPLYMSVWLIHRQVERKRNVQVLFNLAGVPIPELNALRETEAANAKRAFRVNEFSATAPAYNTRVLKVMPPGTPGVLHDHDAETDAKEAVIFSIDDMEELSTVLDLAPQGTEAEFSIDRGLINSRVAFQDSCRWCSGTCPATKLNRLLVSATKSIQPCLNGGPIGRVGEKLQVLRSRATAMFETERLKRGCSTCSARASCSQCLFPHPLTVDEYCHVQRTRPALTSLFDGLILARGLLDGQFLDSRRDELIITSLRLLQEGSIETSRGSIPLSTCVLLGDGANDGIAFIYSQRHQFVAQLPTEAYQPLRALVREARQTAGGPTSRNRSSNEIRKILSPASISAPSLARDIGPILPTASPELNG